MLQNFISYVHALGLKKNSVHLKKKKPTQNKNVQSRIALKIFFIKKKN